MGANPTPLVSYADDLKLFARTGSGLRTLLVAVSDYVGHLGLSLDWDKTKVLFLCTPKAPTALRAWGHLLKVVRELKFLGILVNSRGLLAPARTNFPAVVHRVCATLVSVGLGSCPAALTKALAVKVLPSLLYGCELWGLAELRAVVCAHKSPFLSAFLGPVLDALKPHVGLPATAFNLPVYRLFQIPTFLEMVLPRLARLTTRLSV